MSVHEGYGKCIFLPFGVFPRIRTEISDYHWGRVPAHAHWNLIFDSTQRFSSHDLNLNMNGLLVTRQIDNTSPGVCGGGGGGGGGACARREISPWLSQEMRTWTHSHQTFQQRK